MYINFKQNNREQPGVSQRVDVEEDEGIACQATNLDREMLPDVFNKYYDWCEPQ